MSFNSENNVAESFGKQWIKKTLYHERQKYHLRYQELFVESIVETGISNVLECGAGTGTMLTKIREKISEVKANKVDYYALDNSYTLIKHMKDGININGRNKVSQVNATVDKIPFDDCSFDLVYCISVLWYVENYKNAINEMYRVVRPGGMVCFDIMSLLNITGCCGTLSNTITRLFKKKYSINYVIPSLVFRHIVSLRANYESIGYMPFLPSALPLIGDLFNIFMKLNWLPKIKNAMLQNLCNKVIIKIWKPNNFET